MYAAAITCSGLFEVSVNGYHVKIRSGPERVVVFQRGWGNVQATKLDDGWCDARHQIVIEAIKAFEAAIERAVKP